nr:hypothetical protein GCM10020093_093800 [Planobispora longispora]
MPNPLGVTAMAGPADIAEAVALAVHVTVFVVGGLNLLARARRSTGREREQIKWLAYAVGLALLIANGRLVAGMTDGDPERVYPSIHSGWELLGTLGGILIPAGICVAILRHRLFDIDLVINRTLVYTLLSVCVTGGYILVVGYLGALLPSADLPASVLAAGLVALAFAPLRQRLQGWVNLLMYGERDDPHAALTRLGRRLEASEEPGAALSGVARSVAEALRLPYAAVETTTGLRHASGPEAGDDGLLRLPLVYDGERVGDLILAPGRARAGSARVTWPC